MDYPLITVTIAAYRVEKFIRKSVLSVLEQDYPNIEVLIVDDCGGDSSVDIVNEISNNHPRGNTIKLVSHPKNIGTGGARNTGIDNSTGEYIYFLDGDDYLQPNALSTLFHVIKNSSDDFVVACHQKVDEKGNVIEIRKFPIGHYQGENAIGIWMKEHRAWFPCYLWNKLYRTSFLRKNNIKCILPDRNEDVWFTFQVFCTCKSFTFVDDILLNYVIRDGSTMHQSISDFYINEYVEIMNHICNYLNTHFTTDNMPRLLGDYIGYYFFGGVFTGAVMNSDCNAKVKKDYLNSISIIKNSNFKTSDFCERKNKIIFNLLKYNTRYYLLKIYLIVVRIIYSIHKR